MDTQYKYLHFVAYKILGRWDIKSYLATQYSSQYRMVALGQYIKEESQKYTISDKDTTYGILGVNNQTGIFDAYEESGARIKQKYKRMEIGWIAYNPYRVNVGSIGIKRETHKYAYISPAYVVFSCKEGLLPEYLFMLMKTPIFNKIIRENTTGSVRQNLSYDNLSTIQIPLPSLAEQQALVDAYNRNLQQAVELEQKAQDGEKEIETYLHSQLGIHSKHQNVKKGLNFVRFKDIARWDFESIMIDNSIKSKYTMVPFKSLLLPITGNTTKIQEKEIQIKGKYPVVTQEKGRLIAGYTDNDKLVTDLPLIIFGDHSCAFKYVDFPFVRGADGTKLLKFKKDCNPLFYAYFLPIIHIDNQEKYQRHYKYLENIEIPLPPLDIQQQIVDEVRAQRAKIAEYKTTATTLRQEAITQFEQAIFE